MLEVHIRHGQASASAGWGLTDVGRQQAAAAASYLRQHYPDAFTTGIHSGSRRAVETTELLGLNDVEWTKDARLCEGGWQNGSVPRDFELWRDMHTRVSAVCREWDSQDSHQNRIVVSHGGTMQMIRAYREGFIGAQFGRLFEEPYKFFTNCQMIIYTDYHPNAQAAESNELWVRSVCPWDEGRFGHDWMQIK